MPSLRIASLNLQGAFQKRPWTGDLPRLLADHKPDLVLLQECKKPWLEEICEAGGLEGELSYDLDPELPFTAKDGCAVAVRAPLRILREWRIPPDHFQPKEVAKRIPEEPIPDYEELPANLACRYSGRAPFAEIALDGERFVAASFHATPGRGMVNENMRVHEFKPFFHGAVALALADLELPYVFGIDANEPLSETLDKVTFHWEEGRSGRKKFAALLTLIPASACIPHVTFSASHFARAAVSLRQILTLPGPTSCQAVGAVTTRSGRRPSSSSKHSTPTTRTPGMRAPTTPSSSPS